MAIDFMPNDPGARTQLPPRKVTPRPDRPTTSAHYDVAGAVPEAQLPVGTAGYIYWQCREAALAAGELWDAIHGPFGSWQERKKLNVFPDAGVDLNAYYDRKRGSEPERISFFHQQLGTKTYFSGASTDVVAHECGHAFLDAIRDDFWTSSRFEVNAFHEAFGDCIAVLTALNDKQTRTVVLNNIAKKNPVETTAENLAAGIKAWDPTHNAAEPRRSRNKFQWGPPGSIPVNGGPKDLIYEEHSFGQVFSGCFYDTIVNIFNGLNSQSEGNLLKAALIAGKLLVAATKQAPQRAQYFREVGQAMVLNDEQDNKGANATAIRDAFEAHSITLAPKTMLAPQAALGKPPAKASSRTRAAAKKATPPRVPQQELLRMFGAEQGARLVQGVVNLAGDTLREVIHERTVLLDEVDKRLKGVVAFAPQVALVGRSHAAAAILGHISNAEATVKDVEMYAKSLLSHGRIQFAGASPRGARGGRQRKTVATPQQGPDAITHEVRKIRGQDTLVRVRFACGRF